MRKHSYKYLMSQAVYYKHFYGEIPLDIAILLVREMAIKAGYNPSQPRVPAGNSDGGQWAESGASREGPSRTTTERSRRQFGLGPSGKPPKPIKPPKPPRLFDANNVSTDGRGNFTFRSTDGRAENIYDPPLEPAYPVESILGARVIYNATRRLLARPLARLTDHGHQRTGERVITQKDIRETIRTAHATGNVSAKIGKYKTVQFVYRGSNGITLAIETYGRNAGKVITLFRH